MSMTPLDYWSLLVRDDDTLPLFEAALAIAQDEYPALDVPAILQQVDEFGERLRARVPADAPVQHRLYSLNHLFFTELGFRGNTEAYFDAENSYLNRVIERRSGLPITLALLYAEIGAHAGIPLQGVAFPGHYLVKVRMGDGEAFLDVFNGGVSLSREELVERLEPNIDGAQNAEDMLENFLHAASSREILGRTLRNLKYVFFHNKDWRRLLDVQQRLVILLPEEAAERRDRGLAYAQLECPRAAIDDLSAYLDAYPRAADGAAVLEQIEMLRQAASRLN